MDYHQTYRQWLDSGVLRDTERAELSGLEPDDAEIIDRFLGPLTFGTAGLRGLVGMGTNRMNLYTVRQATWGFGQVILEAAPKGAPPLVCLCFDCRPSSQDFARETAAVLAGMGIAVAMFLQPRPTPELSFAIRQLEAAGGINITASHNPKDYNGYKAYWRGGAQLTGELADAVALKMAAIDPLDCAPKVSFARACQMGQITFLGTETDERYIAACLGCQIDPAVAAGAGDMDIVYTPFHGVGGSIFPELMAQAGYTVIPVPEQIKPDGTFPTLENPNPEDPQGFALAIELARRTGAHLIIGTDPDADRVAAVAPDAKGVWAPISGNQMGGLLCEYIMSARARMGTLPEKSALVQTIVTGGLSRAVAKRHGVPVIETFTGFRFMAEAVERLEHEGRQYLLAWEEAIGYMCGDHVRDKDGITAGLLIAEMAAWHHARGETLWDALEALWRRHGYFAERTVSVPLPGSEGGKEMRKIMGCMRNLPPKVISGVTVVRALDYRKGQAVNLLTREKFPLEKRGMNVLCYILEDESMFIVRPSGTEPKIKVYIHVRAKNPACAAKIADKYAAEAPETLRLWGNSPDYDA